MNWQPILQATPLEQIHKVIERLDIIASKMEISPVTFYITVIAWLALMGMAGLHLTKLYTSVGIAAAGFYAGSALFSLMAQKFAVIAIFPSFTGYTVGLILAFGLFAMAWKFCIPATYLIIGGLGCYLAYLSTQQLWIGIAVGVVCLIVVHLAFSFSILASTGFFAGFGITALLGACLPQISWLQLGVKSPAILIAIGISLLFFVFQWFTTKTYKKFGF